MPVLLNLRTPQLWVLAKDDIDAPSAETAAEKRTGAHDGHTSHHVRPRDIEDVFARLHAHGAELVGELAQYEDKYRLCYVRGSEGIIVALAEQLS